MTDHEALVLHIVIISGLTKGHKGHFADDGLGMGGLAKKAKATALDLKTRVAESPNWRIASYLGEWYEQAVGRNDRLQFVYRKALISILELSWTITNSRDLEKLNGIGPGIRLRIERKLQDDGIEISCGPPASSMSTSLLSTTNPTNGAMAGSATAKKRSRNKAPKEYLPVFRSGPYAMLVALYVDQLRHDSKGYLLKNEIIRLGQQYCNSAMDEGAITPIQGAIKILTTKGLVLKNSIPARFSLTDIGLRLAEKLWNSGERRSSMHIPEPQGTKDEKDEEGSWEYAPPVKSTSRFESFSIIRNQYDIVLLVDTREVKSVDERNYIVNRLTQAGVKSEQRSMELGDFLWIARAKPDPTNPNGLQAPDEIVLDFVIERKIENDLIQSIMDGRFSEQKFRLRASGIPNQIYLLEKCDDVEFNGIMKSRLDAAIMQTQIIDGMYLRYTGGMEESLKFLISLHENITKKYADVDLWAGLMTYPIVRQPYFSYLDEQSKRIGHGFHQSYGSYTQLNHKSANLTVRDVFMKQLRCIRQLATDSAAAITARFPTLLSLFRLYDSLESEQEREHYFKDWIVANSRRKFGVVLSRRIYRLVYGTYIDNMM